MHIKILMNNWGMPAHREGVSRVCSLWLHISRKFLCTTCWETNYNVVTFVYICWSWSLFLLGNPVSNRRTHFSAQGERIHSRLTMMKEFCQFDLYCQRGVIPDLLLISNPPNRAASLKDKVSSNMYETLRYMMANCLLLLVDYTNGKLIL